MSEIKSKTVAAHAGDLHQNRSLEQVDVRGILFDLDGTLLDTEHLLLESFRYATKKVLGVTIHDALLMAKVGQPLDTQMWDFTENEATHDELARVYREYNAVVHDDLIRIFPGTVEALRDLSAAGYSLGVVTSKRHGVAAHGLDTFGLSHMFECLIGSDDWPSHKPDPGQVAHGCDLLGIPAASCIYVGDSPFDMAAGNGAGCFTIAALWGMFPPEVLVAQNPGLMCESIADVSSLLRAQK